MKTQQMMWAIAQHRYGSIDIHVMANTGMPVTTDQRRNWRHFLRRITRRQQISAAIAPMRDRGPWGTSKHGRSSGLPVIVEGL